MLLLGYLDLRVCMICIVVLDITRDGISMVGTHEEEALGMLPLSHT